MIVVRLAIATFTVAMLTTAAAVAGVVDSPLPTISGKKSKHVFTIPGVISHANLATAIVCTSLEKTKTVVYLVEFFASGGGGPENNVPVVILTPGQSAAVSTAPTTFGGGVGLPNATSPRSARVVATSKKLACSAVVLQRQDTSGGLPFASWSLPVIKKTSQKGV